ncbi:hypothetical protein SAMN04489727_2061 [Amycolatopsis tolypomycina]|uniref:Uncharacterized protein n=1 Tax=Amycolatopsis tolypomycina TaxID=208445 RepID=A0A1H4JPG7_9PSEU|nr:hypothetical protein [Amycolatopsis tolypomycina]SEB47796.1 hypothetical protein SAMN04489727_2061 [Amycolatopsis tolypomycina]
MTHYAVELDRGALLAAWPTGRGELATTVAELPTRDPDATGDLLDLASALTWLSDVLWRCYTHPASSALSVEPNSEGWRRQQNRDAFPEVVPAVVDPELPDEQGLLVESYNPVVEAAHQVGRALHAVGDPGLTERVASDVGIELAAVEDAERGELTARARQAVALSRDDVSPVQVEAANQLLHDTLLEPSEELIDSIEPTAAAVAAAHWLHAAATVAAEAADIEITQVVQYADDIEALNFLVPTLVLTHLQTGTPPRAVVISMVREAALVADGRIPDVEALAARVTAARELVARHEATDPELHARLAMLGLCDLNPASPAPDLLEDLLDAIRGCYLVYAECADLDDDVAPEDEAASDAVTERVTAGFLTTVRAEAAQRRDRLI